MPWTEDPCWDLESIFPGRPDTAQFRAALGALDDELAVLITRADALGPLDTDLNWDSVLDALMDIGERTSELGSWVHAWAATHADDPAGGRAIALSSATWSRLERAWNRPNDAIARAPQATFDALVARPALAELVPMLQDMRATAHLLLPPAEQALFSELSEHGQHAWSRFYERISGELRVPVGDERLSSAQALNRLEDTDKGKRDAVFDGMEVAWTAAAEPCAEALTHIFGTRRVLHQHLGVDELEGPLVHMRMERATLDAILTVCARSREVLQPYLRAKARLLGLDGLDWGDLRAPVATVSHRIDYADAQDLVVRQFGVFSQDMADFAERAFAGRWVEAEDRAGKRPGAFCTGLPISRQSRVFMTYGGGLNSVLTLAHELGHAYHNHTLMDINPARRRVTSILAETASIFAETLLRNAALTQASSDAALLDILEKDLADAVGLLHNIPVRYEFERAVHVLRAQGPLDPDALREKMVELQRAWYGPVLRRPHPMFWAEKLHFYISHMPFYNFPYTFGYLFSSLVYAHAQRSGKGWAASYVALLQDTGSGTAEEVARKHLGVDLRSPDAWMPVLDAIAERVDRFTKLAAAR